MLGKMTPLPLAKPVAVIITAVGLVISLRLLWKASTCRGEEAQEETVENGEDKHVVDPVPTAPTTDADWVGISSFGDEQFNSDMQHHLVTVAEAEFLCDSAQVLKQWFNPSSGFYDAWQRQKSLTQVHMTQWSEAETTQGAVVSRSAQVAMNTFCHHSPDINVESLAGHSNWMREFNYHMPLNKFAAMGSTHAESSEVQVLQQRSETRWIATITAKTPNVPMGNLFYCKIQIDCYSIGVESGTPTCDTLASSGCKVTVKAEVVFYKRQPLKERLVKGPAMTGIKKSYRQLLTLLDHQLHCHYSSNSKTPVSLETVDGKDGNGELPPHPGLQPISGDRSVVVKLSESCKPSYSWLIIATLLSVIVACIFVVFVAEYLRRFIVSEVQGNVKSSFVHECHANRWAINDVS